MRILRNQFGFTLIEIAIVLVIVSVLLGYTVAMFPIQQELKQYRQAEKEMNDIIDHLVAFAQVNGRLPCPDTAAGAGTVDGFEDTDDQYDNADGSLATPDTITDSCLAYFGFLPGSTLGINGEVNAQGSLLDPWGQPYGYHVSNINAQVDGVNELIDLVTPNGIREEGLANVTPDLVICNDSDNASAADTTCTAVSANDVYITAAAVVISRGKDIGNVASNIQDENSDDFDDGTNDKVYTFAPRSDVTNAEYDDVVKWVSRSKLYSKMIDAGQLP